VRRGGGVRRLALRATWEPWTRQVSEWIRPSGPNGGDRATTIRVFFRELLVRICAGIPAVWTSGEVVLWLGEDYRGADGIAYVLHTDRRLKNVARLQISCGGEQES
jgi:hypothetical protein